jgi:hypothetical protein
MLASLGQRHHGLARRLGYVGAAEQVEGVRVIFSEAASELGKAPRRADLFSNACVLRLIDFVSQVGGKSARAEGRYQPK